MASVFYLVMFMLYTMMVSNNNLHCRAATSNNKIDYKCVRSLKKIADEMIDAGDGSKFVKGPNGSLIVNPKASIRKQCRFVPKTEVSGSDLNLCKCKVQDFDGNGKEYAGKMILNALDADKELAKSCGFNETDCDTVFRSVQSPCETKAREAMKTCAPMVKAAAEGDLGNRGREYCCTRLKVEYTDDLLGKCTCSSYTVENITTPIKSPLNEFLRFVNNTFRDECDLSAEIYNGPVCELSQGRSSNFEGMVKEKCAIKDFNNMRICDPILKNSRKQANGALPLVSIVPSCCLDEDWCKCDPISESCCRKLGELSKNERDSCMCELINSSKTLDSTLDFLNFVRSNEIQRDSCAFISQVYAGTCVALPPPSRPSTRVVPIDISKAIIKRHGFRTSSNPNP